MKKKITSALLTILLVSGYSHSQIGGIKLGPSLNKWAGFSLESVKGPDFESSEKIKNVLGFHVSPFIEFASSKHFSLTIGLTFRQNGYRGVYYSHNRNFFQAEEYYYEKYDEEKAVLNYLEIPLTAKFGTKIGPIGLYGILGGFVGFGLNGKYVIKGYSLESSPNNDYEFEEPISIGVVGANIRALNLGIIPGFVLEYGLFFLECTYNMGLRKINNFGPSITTRSLNFTLGYKIGSKKKKLLIGSDGQ
jgi:hypothetical protein